MNINTLKIYELEEKLSSFNTEDRMAVLFKLKDLVKTNSHKQTNVNMHLHLFQPIFRNQWHSFLTSIVVADILQYIIMTISAISIGVLAMKALSVETLIVPEGWRSPFFGWRLDDLIGEV